MGKTVDWNTTLNQILENSYDIKLTKTDIDISKVKIKEAQSEYFPKLGIYAYGEFNKDLAPENFKQTMYIGNEVIYGSDIYQNAISAGLTYNLWDFGIRGDNLKIAKKDVISKKANYLKTMRDIELNSVELYAKALSEYKEILIKTEILVIEKELLSIKSRLNQAGQVDKPSVIAEKINADSNFSKQLLDNNKTMLELINTNISMLDRLNENLLIDKQTYLNEKIKLLNQKLSVQKSQISEFTTAYKKFVLNKYNDNIGKL